jgi:hypothetical protein
LVERRQWHAGELGDVVKEFPMDVVGVTMVADGPDAMFAQEILDQGGQIEIVVSVELYRDGLSAGHHPSYERVLS